jgi:hypothetical protein
MNRPALLRRLEEFADRHGLVIGEQLGYGVHGTVVTDRNQLHFGLSALKAFEREEDFIRERDVYLRLTNFGIVEIRGCNVPRLRSFDNKLWVLEMGVVNRPFVLDFAGAQLDRPLDFSEEVMADWYENKREQFGSRWPEVLAILGVLEVHGIYLEDVNPGNISFG